MAAAPPSPEAQQAMRDADWEDRRKLTELLVVSGVFTALSGTPPLAAGGERPLLTCRQVFSLACAC